MSDQSQRPTPPIAAKKPIERVYHGDTVVDDYEWLRDKSDPEVIGYLEAENAYTEASTARLEPLRQQIFDEIKARNEAALNGVGAKMPREEARGKLLATLKTPNDKLPFPTPQPQTPPAPKKDDKEKK